MKVIPILPIDVFYGKLHQPDTKPPTTEQTQAKARFAKVTAAVRTVTNRSEFYQRGDTAVTIQTKTTESYDAKRP